MESERFQEMDHKMIRGNQKRLFVGLVCVTILFLAVLAFLFVSLVFGPNQTALKLLLLIVSLSFAALIFVLFLSVLVIVVCIVTGKQLNVLEQFLFKTVLGLYPMALWIGKIFQVDADTIRGSFVEVNNKLVHLQHYVIKPEQILILAPHCLQDTLCNAKITNSIDNCKHCGNCIVGALIDLARKLDVNLAVVTGGTLARKSILEYRPKAVVAIACERDLASGIMDVQPLPVLGVKNIRPFGPCKNTCVDLDAVEEAIVYFFGDDLNNNRNKTKDSI